MKGSLAITLFSSVIFLHCLLGEIEGVVNKTGMGKKGKYQLEGELVATKPTETLDRMLKVSNKCVYLPIHHTPMFV